MQYFAATEFGQKSIVMPNLTKAHMKEQTGRVAFQTSNNFHKRQYLQEQLQRHANVCAGFLALSAATQFWVLPEIA
jgi:hypothetical protein